MAPTLNIVGCGNVGKVLGRLWSSQGVFRVQDVLNRSPDSAAAAVAFIGAGRAIAEWQDLRPADVVLLGTPDDAIGGTCATLAAHGGLQNATVFHCSGALASDILAPAAAAGAATASVHPIRSFAGPEQVAAGFSGTWCGIEGDRRAVDLLTQAFSAIGARLVPVDPAFKSVYHSAAVFASNYLVTLLDTALEAYVRAGVPREDAQKLLEPLVRGTIDNVFRMGTTAALTGPIARGDLATVVRQYKAVAAWDRQAGRLYKLLGKRTAVIAARRRAGR